MESAAIILWETIHAIDDIQVRLKGYSDIAQASFCAAEGGLVTVDVLHGVFFMLSNGLFDDAKAISDLIDSAADRANQNEALREAHHKGLCKKLAVEAA